MSYLTPTTSNLYGSVAEAWRRPENCLFPGFLLTVLAGLAAWRAGDFSGAIRHFEQASKCKSDAASSLMIERCKQQIENPTAEGWDGTTVARTK